MLENPDASIVPVGPPVLGRPFRFGVLTGAGSDPALTQILIAGWAAVRDAVAPRIALHLVCVGGTPEVQATVAHHDFTILPQTTAPLGQLWNEGFGLLRAEKADSVLVVEPNGIFDAGMVRRYVELMLNEYPSIALFDLYLIHPETGRAVFWTGHAGADKGRPLMTGRCLSLNWLEQVEWAPWPADAATLEAPMIKCMDVVGSRADMAGEFRTCGCRGWEFFPIVLRDDTPEGFFDQEGEAAEARQTDAATLLATHDSPALAVALGAYRRGITEVQPVPTSAPTAAGTEPGDATANLAKAVAKWMAEGEAAFADARLPDAERAFRRAAILEPLRADILNNLAVTRHAQGDSAGAERLLLKAVVFDLDAVDPFVSLAAIAQASGRLALALRYAVGGLERAAHPELIALTRELADKTGNADLMAELDALLAANATVSP